MLSAADYAAAEAIALRDQDGIDEAPDGDNPQVNVWPWAGCCVTGECVAPHDWSVMSLRRLADVA